MQTVASETDNFQLLMSILNVIL